LRGVRRRLMVLLALAAVPATAQAAPSPWATASIEEPSLRLTLSIVIAGNADGTVWEPGGELRCDAFTPTYGGVCTVSVPVGQVFLMEQPEQDATFVGWSGGACSGTSSCTTELLADTTITATFERPEPMPAATSNCQSSGGEVSPPRPSPPPRRPARRIQRLKCGRGTRRQKLPNGSAECMRIERKRHQR
jgi:hypothetical protein